MAIETPVLDRLTPYDKPSGTDDATWRRFMAIWQDMCEKIEAAFTAIDARDDIQDSVIADIQALQTEQASIIADLAAQLALITAAQATADSVTTANAISASWIVPDSVVSATDAGTDATITIANFTRFYDDATSVAVTGASLTGLAYSTTYAIYYDDTTRADGTPTFVATTVLATARHNYVAGRHYLDTITTPASGGGGTSGGGYTPPGGGSPGTVIP